MTATGQEPSARTDAGPHAERDDPSRGGDAVRRVCPYLSADDGGWRSVQATREHRCGATQPAPALAVSKQREMCLIPAHRTCATFVAARDLELASGGVATRGEDDGFWPATRGTVLALEPARSRIGVRPGAPGRAGGQAMLVGLMVLAFLVLVIARTSPPSTSGASGSSNPVAGAASQSPLAGPSGLPSAVPSDAATPMPTPSSTAPASPSPAATPLPTTASSARPDASAQPGATRYRVKSGDTLASIAARFNVSVKKLRVTNGVTGNVIRVGQVLVIP